MPIKMKYKALMLDLDGTTIPNKPDGMPSEKVRHAIIEARKHLYIGVVTARPIFMVKEIFDRLELSGPAIINGGAQIIDSQSKKILYQRLLDKKVMMKLLEILSNQKHQLIIHDDNKKVSDEKKYIPYKPLNIYVAKVKKSEADSIINTISHLPDIVIHKIPSFSPGEVWIEINHALATKQHGIYEVAKLLKINTHEIIGVGDGYNDFPLLMACGLKVAMGNAVPELKEIADYIAPTVEEDGVADVIEKFVLTRLFNPQIQ